jgi:acid stress-induced BolA-like protein IbaG/YrbA
MAFQDKGQLTPAAVALLEQAFVTSVTGQYITDKSAADKTKEIVNEYAANMGVQMKGDKTVTFTITVVTTNLRTNTQVCKWDIIYDKGTVSTKKY